MTLALCLVFFASGAAALLFETLWFRQAGLALGNTVWASALVTAAFMGGLALGNALAARHGPATRRPLLVFARLEVVVGVTGVALVLGLPVAAARLAPLLGSVDEAAFLNALRVTSSFVLLVIPSSAMGATLPVLARAVSAWDPNFGRVLGRLYGWNTLGAVAGALGGELVLIEVLGIRGTALAAGGLDLLAAATAAVLSRRAPAPAAAAPAELHHVPTSLGSDGWRLGAAAFLAGGLLLALEVVWFRFLQLFVSPTSQTFAVMLAVVLLGIALGGLLASFWLQRRPDGHQFAGLLALLSGLAVVTGYADFPRALAPHRSDIVSAPSDVAVLAVRLMLPVCFLSGLLFTLLGKALQARVAEEARATGLLTLANTTGAMLGALAAGFVLLPWLGMERSLFVLACGYPLVAVLVPGRATSGRESLVRGAAWAIGLLAIALFPFGLMGRRYLPLVAQRFSQNSARVVAVQEGLNETVMLLRWEVLGRPLEHRLVTNGISMSATGYVASRYMGLCVWWPVALHPDPKTALVISYGLGTTTRAMVETPGLATIDVVDVSKEVLGLSPLVFPPPATNPLQDPRVKVHVEDGRFFLLTSQRRYDVITAVPPPPKTAGIVNLFSKEYFQLLHDRLAEGGIAAYWLPVYHLEGREARAIIRAFCLAFEDCSLWTGYGLEWMLAGSRGARGPIAAESFARQWRDPVVGARLRAAGLDSPAQLGALFLDDAPGLARFASGQPPLDDDHPYRLSPGRLTPALDRSYFELLNAEGARRRFERSETVRRLWPAEWMPPTLAAFAGQALLDRLLVASTGKEPGKLADLDALLTRTDLEAPVLWLLGSSAEEQELAEAAAAQGATAPLIDELLAIGALSRRDYREAEKGLARAEPHAAHAAQLRQWRILAAGLAGDTGHAARLLQEARPWIEKPGADAQPWKWLAQRFHLPPVSG